MKLYDAKLNIQSRKRKQKLQIDPNYKQQNIAPKIRKTQSIKLEFA